MPQGSFANKPVTSSAQLAALVRKDPKVAARYAAHFGVPPRAIADYMQTHLALRPLSRGGKYLVFFVRDDGSIGKEVRHLPKGKKVFVHLPSGQPLLLGECGNPLVTQLPSYAPQQAESVPVLVDSRPEVSVSEPLPDLPLEPPVVTAVYPVLPEPSALPETMETITLALWQGEPILSTEGLEPAATTASRDTDFLLVPLLLVALVGVIEGTHSASPPPFVIPEPASMASLAAGMALLAVWERRRRLKRSREPL